MRLRPFGGQNTRDDDDDIRAAVYSIGVVIIMSQRVAENRNLIRRSLIAFASARSSVVAISRRRRCRRLYDCQQRAIIVNEDVINTRIQLQQWQCSVTVQLRARAVGEIGCTNLPAERATTHADRRTERHFASSEKKFCKHCTTSLLSNHNGVLKSSASDQRASSDRPTDRRLRAACMYDCNRSGINLIAY